MLTRRSVMLSGAVAGAAPLFPSFSHLSLFAEATSPKANTAKSAAPVVFSPALASYVASSGAVITKKLNQEGPSVRALKGAASLLRIAADHAHQNSLDALVQVLLNHQPDLSHGTKIHAATTQAIAGYRAFDPAAKMPDASFALNLTAEQSATMHAYVAKVGMTGVLRDMADLVSTTAHARHSLSLKRTGLETHTLPMFGDGVLHSTEHFRLRRVCSTQEAKKTICTAKVVMPEAAVGLVLATLTLACNPWVLGIINVELPGISIPLDAACAVFMADPAAAIAAVMGFALAVLTVVQAFEC